jgi:integrase|tara:strand:+ start:284 stop:1378 length:1095 start_codon:yes stop_codon:yes gene_type:complete
MAVKLRQRKYKKKGSRFYLDIYENAANRTAQYLDIWLLPTDTADEKKDKRELARQIRNRTEQDLESKNYRDVLPKYKKETDFLIYAKDFIEKYPNKDKKKVQAAVNHFILFLGKKKIKKLAVDSFNESLAFDFIEYLKKDSGLTASTPASYLEKLTRIVRAAMRDKYMISNPFEYLSKKGLNKEGIPKNVLNNEELQQVFTTFCSNSGIRKAFIIACYTGMGESELRNLKWSDINFKDKTIIYTRNKTGVQANNFLHPMIEQQLIGLDRSKDTVFNGELPTSTNGINKVLKTWVQHAGITKKITFYCARHTFGTSVCRVSGNQKVVAEAMGHKSTRFTDRYTKIVEEEHIKAVQQLPSFSAEIS